MISKIERALEEKINIKRRDQKNIKEMVVNTYRCNAQHTDKFPITNN